MKREENTYDVIVAGGGLSGVAAAVAVKQGVAFREVNISEVHDLLDQYGALY